MVMKKTQTIRATIPQLYLKADVSSFESYQKQWNILDSIPGWFGITPGVELLGCRGGVGALLGAGVGMPLGNGFGFR
jgi:hypothetical protein